jgi:pimeloyl-ACP methyl ester carboxylesterase
MRSLGHVLRGSLVRVAAAALFVVSLGGLFVYLRYRQDIAAHEARIAAESRLAETPCGLIEYGERGEGTPLLALHGAGGGYDQGLMMADLIGAGFRVIAPSRFGYLNAPIPADASVAAQADAYACLLDHLNLSRVTVVAFSAGGPSALDFALRYPERVDRLVLVSALSTLRPVREDGVGPSPQMLSDFGYWALVNTAPDLLLDALGVPAASRAAFTPTERERAGQVLDRMLPMARRNPGNDTDVVEQNLPTIPDFPLNEIAVPTLVIHAQDDTLVPYAQGAYSAAHIPGARLVTYETGGHLVIARDAVWTEIRAFLGEDA